MELAVIFVIFLIFAVPVGLVLLGVAILRGRRSGGKQTDAPTDVDERLDRIEAELDEIQATLADDREQ